jgi:hypothetical protein
MFVTLVDLATERRALDAAEAAWLARVGEYHDAGMWDTDGFGSAAAALGASCHLDEDVARRHVKLARRLARLPDVANAFGGGDISARHAAVIANAYTRKREAELSAIEPELLDVATKFAPSVLAAVVQRVTDAIDGDDGASADEKDFERRSFSLAQSLDGRYYMKGQCDALSGEILQTAIKAEMARDLQENDHRGIQQRRLDALVNLARLALDRGEVGEAHGIRPHISAVVHLEHPAGDLVARMRRERHRDQRLSNNTLDMLMCDCLLSRVIVAGQSEILDVGRTTRTATAAQWKALVARDGHCQAPGCNRPPSDCQAHHIRPWAAPHFGPTNLDNLRLLCWYHRKRHTHDAQARAA